MPHFNGNGQSSCPEVMQTLVLFIDNEIDDANQMHTIELHLEECPNCLHTVEAERNHLQMMKDLLSRACCESAPTELEERIALQTQALASQMQAAYFSTQQVIIQHEITIEIRQEFFTE